MDTTTLPDFPDHSWRPLRADDAPRLLRLRQATLHLDGNSSPSTLADYQASLAGVPNLSLASLALTLGSGDVVAAGWLHGERRSQQVRVFLDYLVEADYRRLGVEEALIKWLEGQAAALFADAHLPILLRVDFYDRSTDSQLLLKDLGYDFHHAEIEMRYDLRQPLPMPEKLRGTGGLYMTLPWSNDLAHDFFSVYQHAFRERPGFPNWSQAMWMENFTDSPHFRPDLSWLVKQSDPQAYVICHVEGEVGWIAQIGVHPRVRQKGLAKMLLLEALNRFREEGLSQAALDVNINNAPAITLYENLGFKTLRRYHSFQKGLA